MKRTIELSLETAINFYKKGGEFKELALSAYTEEELTMAQLPKSWEEYFNSLNEIAQEAWRELFKRLPAQRYIALMKLEALRDCYLDGKRYPNIHCIKKVNRTYHVLCFSNVSNVLSFPNRVLAEHFLRCFINEIKEAGDLI